MRILYLIPARKGSKGLPGKNTKKLGGKPLIEYTIDFALNNITVDDELCISTNDLEVIHIAESKGIPIPFIRPEELATDNASSHDVIIHAINHYENLNQIFDAVLLLQPTSPFRIQDDLVQLKNAFQNYTDMVVSVKIAKENPYYTLFEENNNGFLVKCKVENFDSRQECPKSYLINGSMYLINIESIKNSKIVDFKRVKKIVMSDHLSIDIDTAFDFDFAEYLLKKNK
jgi:CMP-N,N'-diacetyllegionaminic acid synthase